MARTTLVLAGLLLAVFAQSVSAQDDDSKKLREEMKRLRKEMKEMKKAHGAQLDHLTDLVRKLQAKQAKSEKDEIDKLREQMRKDSGVEEDKKQKGLLRQYVEQLISQQRPNAFNPRITVFGDFLAAYRSPKELNDEGNEVGSRLALREIEVDLRADIDPYAKGVLILALEEHDPNEFEIGVEEGYLTFHRLGGAEQHGLQAKLGRFRLGFGQLNKLHLHDLPQYDYPLVVQEFLGEEGAVGNGINLSWAIPNPMEADLQLDIELINAELETIFPDGPRRNIGGLARLKWFKDLSPTMFFELGASHMYGRGGAEGTRANLTGIDFLYRWRPEKNSQDRSLVFQTEAFALHRSSRDEDSGAGFDVDSFGAYAYLQYQFARRWYAGVRGDWTEPVDPDSGDKYGASAYLSFYTSEFLRIRFGVQRTWDRSLDDEEVDTAFIQFSWVFGSHPVEPYWFNK